jgi:hypothetical protein
MAVSYLPSDDEPVLFLYSFRVLLCCVTDRARVEAAKSAALMARFFCHWSFTIER